MLLLDIGSFWKLEAVIETKLKLPSLLDSLILLFVNLALLSHNRSCACNLIFSILVSSVVGEH
jgi:hypothetical protein